MTGVNTTARDRAVTISRSEIVGVILAGGQSRRMGGSEKSLLDLCGAPLVMHVRNRLAPQVRGIVLNANGDPLRFRDLGLPVVADTIKGFAGPLAGVLAGMRWAAMNHPTAQLLASAAADTPFFPSDLVMQLAGACDQPDAIAIAASAGNRHPVFGLWPIRLADPLEAFLATGDTGKVMAFAGRYPLAQVEFEFSRRDDTELDPFFNVNTPQDLQNARLWAQSSVEEDGCDRQ